MGGCVLTGDSASGKTESLKHILGYIVNVVVPIQASLKSKFLQVLQCDVICLLCL